MSHSLLIRKVMGGRQKHRYSKNNPKDDGPLPLQGWQEGVEQGSLVGPFIFFNHQIRTNKTLKLQKALLPSPEKDKEHPKETRTPAHLLKQVNLLMNIFPFFKKLKRIKILLIMVKQA